MRVTGIRRPTNSAGFTLLEILVVVIIIGVVASVFLLSVDTGDQDPVRDQARRFAALTRLAGQEAMLGSRDMAVELFADGYRFVVNEEQEWRPVEDAVLSPQQFPEGISWEVHIDGVGNGSVTADEVPRIYLFSTGEMTPFEVTLGIDGQDDSYRVTGGLDGKLDFNKQQ
jgi:general secretion pathway protein H